jgi:hypothetical protein
MRLVAWLSVVAIGGCLGGSATGTRPDPEICDDGIDNDGDGLADCDDTDSCGGLACIGTTTTTYDTSANLPNADIAYSPATCCDFEFGGPTDCPTKVIGTVEFFNRAYEEAGEFDISCDLVGGESPVQWQVAGAATPEPFVVNQNLFADDSIVVSGVFVCAAGVNNTFTTTCRANIEVGANFDEVEFEITGTALQ